MSTRLSQQQKADEDALAEAAKVRGQRHRRWLIEGEPSVSRRIAQIGVLGWMIVTPTLIGVFAGRWLDHSFGSGLTWTGALLVIGLAIGCWSGWQWVNRA